MKDTCDNDFKNKYAMREYSHGYRLKDKRSNLDILFHSGTEFAIPSYDLKLDKPLTMIPGAVKANNMQSESVHENIENFIISGIYIDEPELNATSTLFAKYLTVSDHKGAFEVGAIPIYYGFANEKSTEDTRTVIRYNDVEMGLDIKIETYYDRNIPNNKHVAKIHRAYDLKKRNKVTTKFKEISFVQFALSTDNDSSIKERGGIAVGNQYTLNLLLNSKGRFYAGVIMSNGGYNNTLQPDIYPDPRKDSTRSYNLFRTLMISFPCKDLDNQLHKRYTEYFEKWIYSTMNALSPLSLLATSRYFMSFINRTTDEATTVGHISETNIKEIVENVCDELLSNIGNVAETNVKTLYE